MAKKTSTGSKVAAGLAVAALATAAAAAYYLTGSKGKQHRLQVKAWAKQARSEMLQRVKKMKSMSKQTYDTAAKEVLAKYKQAKNIDPAELAALGAELKGHWDDISKKVSKLGAAKKAGGKKRPTKGGARAKK